MYNKKKAEQRVGVIFSVPLFMFYFFGLALFFLRMCFYIYMRKLIFIVAKNYFIIPNQLLRLVISGSKPSKLYSGEKLSFVSASFWDS